MMGSVEDDPFGECVVGDQDTSVDQLISPDSPDVNDVFGDPQVLSRVGDQYQVDIPPLVTESELLQLLSNPIDQNFMVDSSHSFLMGLPISIIWIHDKSDRNKIELVDFLGNPDDAVKRNGPIEFENSKESSADLNDNDSRVKDEPLDFASDSERGLGGLSSCKLTETGIENNDGLTLSQDENLKLVKYKGQGYCPAPGSLSSSWSVFEQESFLLGLYIFGKNLVQVKNFIERKEMGDVLSFYYGKFYRSDAHQRWSECRKIRSRRCIHGQRIFTGWRQQEFLSRLLPRVPEECQNTLLEVSRRFGDGKISLEEYVSALKDNVGMTLFIEAVGIGKGKQDLTGIVMEPLKTNQVIHNRLEIPVGKACASLTYEDIIRFLSGDFRLSKARTNDLFWEAVWPRLLANGWNSQKPKSRDYAGSKNSLVFLIPGINKFSKSRLVKGSQYFDSVTDVLNKVASDPRLIELEGEEQKSVHGDKEDEHGTKVELDEDSNLDHQRRSFLRPRVSNTKSALMLFTVVDTSLVHGEESGRVAKLRKLPVTTIKDSAPTISRKDAGENCEEPVDTFDSIGIRSNDQEDDQVVCSNLSGSAASSLKQGVSTKSPEPTNLPLETKKDGHVSIFEKNPSMMIKCQFSRRRKREQPNNVAPATKRRRLSDCSQDDATRSTNDSPKENEKEVGSCKGSDGMFDEADPSHEKILTVFSAKVSPNDSSENVVTQEKSPPRTLIDLNLPHLAPESETSENSSTKMEKSLDYQSTIDSFSPENNSRNLATQQPPVVTARRQSTRNRPLTTKAMEALACGLLTNKRKWRGMVPVSQEKYIPKPSRRAKVSVSSNFGDLDSKGLEEERSGDTNWKGFMS